MGSMEIFENMVVITGKAGHCWHLVWKVWVLLNILQETGQTPTTKNNQAQNNTAQVEKSLLRGWITVLCQELWSLKRNWETAGKFSKSQPYSQPNSKSFAIWILKNDCIPKLYKINIFGRKGPTMSHSFMYVLSYFCSPFPPEMYSCIKTYN